MPTKTTKTGKLKAAEAQLRTLLEKTAANEAALQQVKEAQAKLREDVLAAYNKGYVQGKLDAYERVHPGGTIEAVTYTNGHTLLDKR